VTSPPPRSGHAYGRGECSRNLAGGVPGPSRLCYSEGVTVLRRTRSLCPVCRESVAAELVEDAGRIWMDKSCPAHGPFRDLVSSDAGRYRAAEVWAGDGTRLSNPRTSSAFGCPRDCGICPGHSSATLLAIVDVTNRCDLRCPVCFASAATRPVYEPSFGLIASMLENLRANRPAPPPGLQLSGGEPTLRNDLPDIVRKAKELGFRNVQVNTNGIRIARDPGFLRDLVAAGLGTLYLQFDGLSDDVYRALRGRGLAGIKARVLDNCRAAGLRSVVLVPTLVKGINDMMMGDVVRFAAENFDVVRGVNFQPVSFAGRTDLPGIETGRITLADVARGIEEQTGGALRASDFFPIPSVLSLGRAVSALRRKPSAEFSAHPQCGLATYVFVEKSGLVPITRKVRVEPFLASLDRAARAAAAGRRLRAGAGLAAALRFVRPGRFARLLRDVLRNGAFEAVRRIHYEVILVSAMHFMDARDFDEDRLRRCVIHYAAPDGRIIPFCAYNTLGYREEIEGRAARSDRPAVMSADI
jgi:uncharacterized radical SAM superfamily Fe-S cluster-containing enzyme